MGGTRRNIVVWAVSEGAALAFWGAGVVWDGGGGEFDFGFLFGGRVGGGEVGGEVKGEVLLPDLGDLGRDWLQRGEDVVGDVEGLLG